MSSKSQAQGPPALRQCQNPTCFKSSKDMRRCAGCGRAHYCGSECQKQDWKAHKKKCRENAAAIARIKEDSKAGATDGDSTSKALNLSKLEHDLKKWVQTQRPLLTWAAIQALELRTKPDNQFSHCLYLALSPNSSLNPSHRFNVGTIDVMTFGEARATMSTPRQDALETAAKTAREVSAAQNNAIVPLVIITLGPIMRFIPVGFPSQEPLADYVAEDSDWEATFKRRVLGFS